MRVLFIYDKHKALHMWKSNFNHTSLTVSRLAAAPQTKSFRLTLAVQSIRSVLNNKKTHPKHHTIKFGKNSKRRKE